MTKRVQKLENGVLTCLQDDRSGYKTADLILGRVSSAITFISRLKNIFPFKSFLSSFLKKSSI